ncbi:MAG TPA: AMP-binding protein [Acidimicrobiales bacterium]|nr:AMP-binding protein [Acidimicrobiales bacterium]
MDGTTTAQAGRHEGRDPAVAEADLWRLLERRAGATADATFLVERSGRRSSFAEVHRRAAALAAGLARSGVSAGDTVAWELPTTLEAVELTLALHRLGTTQVPIIAIYRDREVTHCCAETGARWLVTTAEFRGYDFAAMGARVAAGLDLTHLLVEDVVPADPAELAEHDVDPDEPRWVFYTSGTTAAPRGARHADRALSSIAGEMAGALRLGPDDRYALVFPLPHVGGILLLFAGLQTGCCHLLDAAFDPVATPAFLAAEGVTHAGTGTPFHLAYLEAQRQHPAGPLFPRLRCCPGGAAPKPPDLHARVRAELGGVGILSSWGLTEAPILTFCRFDDPDDKLAATEGRALPDVALRAVGADGGPVAEGLEGELQVRGGYVMAGYVDATLDAEVLTEDGWLRTGDLGVIDEDGYVTITGRLKDVIIRNGENVSAKEVEDLLYAHPRVAEAAVFGLPDVRTGERMCAVVCPTAGADPLTFEEMVEYLRSAGLRPQALPERLEHLDRLPRNPAGKVTKRVLQDRFGDGATG